MLRDGGLEAAFLHGEGEGPTRQLTCFVPQPAPLPEVTTVVNLYLENVLNFIETVLSSHTAQKSIASQCKTRQYTLY